MNIKNLPHWLKFGIVFGLIPLVVYPLVVLLGEKGLLFFIIFFWGEGGLSGVFLGMIGYFIIGAIIGWVYDKIKNRKKL